MFRSMIVAAFAATTLLSAGTAGAAFAGDCNDMVAIESSGHENDAMVDSRGCNYTGVFMDADFGHVRTEVDGHGIAQVLGQEGVGNDIDSEITGSDIGLGVHQATNGARFTAQIDGERNKVAGYQTRSGAVADIKAEGEGITIVTRQH